MNKTPTVLLIGVTGQLGNLIAQNLRKDTTLGASNPAPCFCANTSLVRQY